MQKPASKASRKMKITTGGAKTVRVGRGGPKRTKR